MGKKTQIEKIEADASINWVRVGACLSLQEADLLRLHLRSAGIPVRMNNQYTVAAVPHLANAVGGVELLVPQKMAKRALAILDSGSFPDCPKCHGSDVEACVPTAWWFLLALLMLTIPLWNMKKRWRCKSCGYAWSVRR